MTFNSNRKYGIELEFFNVNYYDLEEYLKDVVDVYLDDQDENDFSSWHVSDDGSITGANSVELVSPILSGSEGLKEIKRALGVVNRFFEPQVNKSCGFHVHVNARDMSYKQIFNVWNRYARFENVIDQWIPKSRRSNLNEFCRSMQNRNTMLNDFINAEHLSKNEFDIFINRCVQTRYLKLNVMAFLEHGTIEFRHHSGTLNREKITNWIQFCVNFVEETNKNPNADLFDGIPSNLVEYFSRRTQELSR